MNFSTVLFLIVFGFSTSSNVRVPLHNVPEGLLGTRATNIHSGVVFEIIFGHHGDHGGYTFRVNGEEGETVDVPIESSGFRLSAAEILNVFRDLVPRVGPVAYQRINNGFELVVNSTDDHFRSSCLPDSTLSLQLTRDQSLEIGAAVPSASSQDEFFILFRTDFLGRFPISIFESIITAIANTGAIREYRRGHPERFYNCTADLIVQLPEDGSHLTATPEDYLDFDPVNRSCQLKVEYCSRATGLACTFSPLALGGMNMRITPNYIVQFCDSV